MLTDLSRKRIGAYSSAPSARHYNAADGALFTDEHFKLLVIPGKDGVDLDQSRATTIEFNGNEEDATGRHNDELGKLPARCN